MTSRARWLFPAVGILFLSSVVHAVPVHQWSKSFGGSLDNDVGNSVATDGSGNVVITGSFIGTANFGGGPLTANFSDAVYVAKYDANGNHLWSRKFGDSSVGYSVATDGSGNVVVTGRFSGTIDFGGGPLTSSSPGDIFVAKLDANGNHLWSRRFGDAIFFVGPTISVATDGSGNVVVTGFFAGTVDFGGGPLAANTYDIFVAKFDANGSHVWSRQFGDGDFQEGTSVATDGSGNIVIAGYFRGTVDFGGGGLTSAGYDDIFVAKFDGNGNHLWSQRFGDSWRSQVCNSVAVDGSSNIVITGTFDYDVDFGGGTLTSAGVEDIFVAKFDGDGNHLWSQRFGDASLQDGKSVAVDGSGNVFITGRFAGSANFGGGALTSAGLDIFVAKFDGSGNHIWSQRFGDASTQRGLSVATDALGNALVTGDFFSSVNFGGDPLTSVGEFDIFLAKFGEPPVPVLITSFLATPRNGAVEVTWDVWSDEDLASFTLYRRDETSSQPIVVAEGLFDAGTRSYVDASVKPDRTYHYELLIHTTGGNDIRSAVATVTMPSLRTALGQNFPNPFRPETSIEYTLGERSKAVVGIYDASGRLVARLDQGVREAGTYRAEWNGRDSAGSVVGSGVYFYRLEGVPNVAPKKMVLLK